MPGIGVTLFINDGLLVRNPSSDPKEFSEQFIDLKTTCGFSQVVDFTTREDKTLEGFLTNRPSLINRVTPIPGISDQ
jgi:hypothetical protein